MWSSSLFPRAISNPRPNSFGKHYCSSVPLRQLGEYPVRSHFRCNGRLCSQGPLNEEFFTVIVNFTISVKNSSKQNFSKFKPRITFRTLSSTVYLKPNLIHWWPLFQPILELWLELKYRPWFQNLFRAKLSGNTQFHPTNDQKYKEAEFRTVGLFCETKRISLFSISVDARVSSPIWMRPWGLARLYSLKGRHHLSCGFFIHQHTADAALPAFQRWSLLPRLLFTLNAAVPPHRSSRAFTRAAYSWSVSRMKSAALRCSPILPHRHCLQLCQSHGHPVNNWP